MKNIKLVMVPALVLLAVLAAFAPVIAQATKTNFSGTETIAGPPVPGTPTFPDGNFHMRGHTVVFADVTDDPRVSGLNTVVANWNFRPAPPPVMWTGPEWGTFHIENEGGSWDGTWTGKRYENGHTIINGVGHGSGDYAGLKGHWTYSRLSPDPAAPYEITGWILEP
jgi:hypothetical protein